MITSIYMKNCATYNNEGGIIQDCKKVNFFYGANGSGKSTISDYLSKKHPERYRDCSYETDGSNHPIMVYNREFRETNFHQSDIAGVFTLGASTIEDIKELEELKSKKDGLDSDIITKKESIKKENDNKTKKLNDFKNNIWDAILKQYEKAFADSFTGFRSSKDKFYDEIIRRYINTKDLSTDTFDELSQKSKELYGNNTLRYEHITSIDSSLITNIYQIEKHLIWNTVIVGNKDISIASLIDSLDNSRWVSEGRKYIRETGICPFCQKPTIDKNFMELLSKYFDGKYKEQMAELDSISEMYNDNMVSIVSQIRNSFLDVNDEVASIIGIDKNVIDEIIFSIDSIKNENINRIDGKKTDSGRKICLESISECINKYQDFIERTNSKIDEHNAIIDNLDKEKEKLADKVWNFCLTKQKSFIDGFMKEMSSSEKAIAGMKRALEEKEKNAEELNIQIIEKGKSVTSVEPTVKEINRLLNAYGFNGFKIAPSKLKENSYQIQRLDGTLVENTLSEGEETFISFLYFMQLTKGATNVNHISDKKIIILDDPICSLDSTILYIVSTMVKRLIEDVRNGSLDVDQLFILTHNVFFHKEASFINGRTKECKDISYWIIKKDEEISTIYSYGIKNPISTSYDLLWQELRENTSTSLITVQNIMRRIIENYFGILGGKKEDYIKDKFDTVEDQIICDSLLYWINDGSHTIPDDLYIDSYSGTIDRYQKVFRNIFYKTGNIAHYNMMMGIEGEE